MAYDNVLKRLAEEYPSVFVQWLLAVDELDIQKLPTELSLEPVRSDAVYFLPQLGQILHIEFQTEPQSNAPLPLRLLDYWVRLYRQHRRTIKQVVIFLKPTNTEVVFTEEFAVGNTVHRYQVIRMWEQDPTPLLANPALLPLAVLARTDAPTALLQQVAAQVELIEELQQQREISAYTEILAGLKFDKDLIRRFLREELMRESVIYQEIEQESRQKGEATLILRQLARRVGQVAPEVRSQIQQQPVERLEELGEALLDFSSAQDLTDWLENHQQ
ncbi:MAG: Rpn family recombination-promoting nuclease/putative transposase [Chroococcidiopsidaceae cyanobacterium CP_BM_RX_35]|nr:Rpn family recombination-promoting nuclease/putative transposase [Chroococcidiopsidaceae cyanobacterium CP_BM_RX_35]